MAVVKTQGGNRLKSGGKQQQQMDTFQRSNHNTGFIWKSTMAAGTLVPFYTGVLLKGGTKDIKLDVRALTEPTVGQQLDAYELRLGFFKAPMRLYHKLLHNQRSNLGNKMQTVLLPQLRIRCNDADTTIRNPNISQINPSSLLAYMGVMGCGHIEPGDDMSGIITRDFLGMHTLMEAEVWKNYFANQQEEIGYVLQTKISQEASVIINAVCYGAEDVIGGSGFNWTWTPNVLNTTTQRVYVGESITVEVNTDINADDILIKNTPTGESVPLITEQGGWERVAKKELPNGNYEMQFIKKTGNTTQIATNIGDGVSIAPTATQAERQSIELVEFPLTNIDDMRDRILAKDSASPLIIGNGTGEVNMLPYSAITDTYKEPDTGITRSVSYYAMNGLKLVTHDVDRFNSFINTGWIEAIDDISSIDTSEGSFTVSTLIIKRRVYNYLNKIAFAGGTYGDWLETTTGEKANISVEAPEYEGGMSVAIGFEEVLSTSGTETDALGTRGGTAQTIAKEGGHIRLKAENEHELILGCAWIVPKQGYSQGNEWFMNIRNMDQWHKPEFDGIAFQDLIMDEFAAFDTKIVDGEPEFHSMGKQVSWQQYMTNQGKIKGNFAAGMELDYMVLDRGYVAGEDGTVEDATTYIDPLKYQYPWVDQRRDAQNFQIVIKVDEDSRLLMGARQIPRG